MGDKVATPCGNGIDVATQPSGSGATGSASIRSPEGQPAKRQKVTRACDRCKARKRRCNGEMPCTVCQSFGKYCTYNAVYTRGKVVGPLPTSSPNVALKLPAAPSDNAVATDDASSESDTATASFGGQYLGPTSAYSFLRRAWERFGRSRDDGAEHGEDVGRAVSVFAYGDRRTVHTAGEGAKILDKANAAALVDVYFDYAMPTYRFLHRPTVSGWVESYHAGTELTQIRQAIVLLVFATASLFNAVQGFAGLDSEDDATKTAERFFQSARRIVSEETGKAKLESVQARLAICLYLLHTSRPNQAWYTFGTTVQMMFALGLHRKHQQSFKGTDLATLECRKRTCWAAATLDTYLSIMLGRPFLIHEEDVDQDFPASVHDEDLLRVDYSKGDAAIEASILHAKIGWILKRASYEQYSMHRKPNQRKGDEAVRLNKDLADWRASLPLILSGAVHTANLVPVFRRQVLVIQLAHAHAIMFVNRPSLLAADTALSVNTESHIQACLTASKGVLDSLMRAVHDGTAFNAFWFTQYVAFSALSIVYIWLIQRRRGRIMACGVPYEDGELLRLAEEIQGHLAKATQTNAPSLRYSAVLSELQQEARRLVMRERQTPPMADQLLAATDNAIGARLTASIPLATGAEPQADSDTSGLDPFSWETMNKEFPLDPDLWLQLDAFPFSDIALDEWTSPT